MIDPSTVLTALCMTATPQNYDRRYTGDVSILTGVSASMNTIACRVVEKIGTDYSFDYAKNKFGLSTSSPAKPSTVRRRRTLPLAPPWPWALSPMASPSGI